MGATVPLAMWAIRRDSRIESSRSFSFLYTSNVMGAIAGALVPLALIELYGFHGTLRIGACLNAAIALTAIALSFRQGVAKTADANQTAATPGTPVEPARESGVLVLLFLTGFATMGMEVIWIRLYTAFIGTLVYSFALILASYLVATAIGAIYYR